MKAPIHFISLLLTLALVGFTSVKAQRASYVLDLVPISKSASVTDIYLSSSMLKNTSLDFKDSSIPSMDDLFHSTESIRIFTPEDPAGATLLRNTFAPICDLKNNNYETLFSIKSDGALVSLVGKRHGDRSNELYLIVDDKDEVVAIIFQGNYSKKQIDRLLSETKVSKTPNSKVSIKQRK